MALPLVEHSLNTVAGRFPDKRALSERNIETLAAVNPDSDKYSVKIPLQNKCPQCGQLRVAKIHLGETSFDWICPKCSFSNGAVLGYGATVGFLILERSRYELTTEHDPSMSIVFAAMAFDSELSYLFGKWTKIDAVKAEKDFDRAECEKTMRAFGTIDRKIAEVSQFLVQKDIDEFVSADAHLRETVSNGFESLRIGSLASDFQKHLFWPRNAILHWGDTRHSYEEAAQCFNLADLGIQILRKMDAVRRQTSG